MGEPLKNQFGPDVVDRIAAELAAVHDGFDIAGFLRSALDGFDDLELTSRCRQVAASMAAFLPADPATSIDLLVASLGPELPNADPTGGRADGTDNGGANRSMFHYLPHGYFLADHGAGHFERVMTANYEITKRGTSEFSIRTPLRDETEATLKRLRHWAGDPNVHVRRLVSEGTRPRLPWSFPLNTFQQDPAPVVQLLELLKDDPVEYVRRSVANNLNDIAKDHPDVVIEAARRWWPDGDENRRRLIRHGLRTLIKSGNLDALAVIGYGPDSPIEPAAIRIEPATVTIGDTVAFEIDLTNPSDQTAGALVDMRIHYVKANGSTSPKVFKGVELSLAPGESAKLRKSISFAQRTTRTHYPGVHRVELLVNGRAAPAGEVSVQSPV